MAVRTPFSLSNRYGDALHADLYTPLRPVVALPVVVCIHGIKGFKDWGFWEALGTHLADAGLACITFNLSYNGIGDADFTTFTRLDLFERNTLSRELSDVQDFVEGLNHTTFRHVSLDLSRLGLLGHSRGGGIAIISATQIPAIKTMVTWNAVSDFFQRFTPAMCADWDAQGYTEIRNDRTGQMMRLGRGLYDDALQYQALLDLKKRASEIHQPWLLVHAKDDNVVPFDHALRLKTVASAACTLVEASGQHAFGATHPQTYPLSESLVFVLNQTTAFFKTHL